MTAAKAGCRCYACILLDTARAVPDEATRPEMQPANEEDQDVPVVPEGAD